MERVESGSGLDWKALGKMFPSASCSSSQMPSRVLNRFRAKGQAQEGSNVGMKLIKKSDAEIRGAPQRPIVKANPKPIF